MAEKKQRGRPRVTGLTPEEEKKRQENWARVDKARKKKVKLPTYTLMALRRDLQLPFSNILTKIVTLKESEELIDAVLETIMDKSIDHLVMLTGYFSLYLKKVNSEKFPIAYKVLINDATKQRINKLSKKYPEGKFNTNRTKKSFEDIQKELQEKEKLQRKAIIDSYKNHIKALNKRDFAELNDLKHLY